MVTSINYDYAIEPVVHNSSNSRLQQTSNQLRTRLDIPSYLKTFEENLPSHHMAEPYDLASRKPIKLPALKEDQ